MGEYITKPVCKILMLKGETGYKGDKGEGIPTGGTTGQFLKKKSNTDYEYEWADITTVKWDNVSGKPDSYPTTWDSVSGKPSNITNAEIDTIVGD